MTTLETSLIGTEGAGTKDTGTESTSVKGECIKGICLNGTCIWASTCSGDACIRVANMGAGGVVGAPIRDADIGGTCIKGIWIGVAFIVIACIESVSDEDTYVGSICAGSASAIEYSEMDSQFFRISKVKLFDTWLEIGVGVCQLSLRLFWMLSWLTSIVVIFEVGGTGLNIRVG